MLYLRVSPNREFFINELWVLIPLMLVIDVVVIVALQKHSAKKKLKPEQFKEQEQEQEQERLKEQEQLKKKCKRWKIFNIATGNIIAALLIRGGEDILGNYIEIKDSNDIVNKDFRDVKSNKLRKIVYRLFKLTAKNGGIYVTKTALCYLVTRNGLDLSTSLISAPEFIGISGWSQLVRKTISVAFLGIPLPMLILTKGRVSKIISLAAAGIGTIGIIYTKDPGFLIISTSVISTPLGYISRCIAADQPDLNLELETISRIKIAMPGSSMSYECSLPDQIIYNTKCGLRPSEIADIATNADVSLNYDEVVNMQDVTKLTTVKFSDKFKIPSISKLRTNFSLRGRKRFKNLSKTQNFLEKFGDPKLIPNTEQWDISTPTPQNAIRIQDGQL